MSLNTVNLIKTKWAFIIGLLLVGLIIILVVFNYYASQSKGLPSDIYFDHYHPIEEYSNSYYVIREFDMDDPNNFYRELWKYDKKTFEGEKIFKASGIDFRVSPNENYVAIQYSLTRLGTDFLAILNLRQNNKKVFETDMKTLNKNYGLYEDENFLVIGPVGWSDDGDVFWFSANWTAYIVHFFEVNIAAFEVEHHNVGYLNLHGSESELDFALEKLVYSDHPAMYGFGDSLDNLLEQEKVTLYIYDFNAKTKKILATSTDGPLNPKWIDNKTIEYTEYPSELTEELSKLLEEMKQWRESEEGHAIAEEEYKKMEEVYYEDWAGRAQRKRIILE